MSIPVSTGLCQYWSLCRDAAADRDTHMKTAVAKLARMAAISEMKLETLELQAEGNRIGQLGVSTGGIMGTAVTLQLLAE